MLEVAATFPNPKLVLLPGLSTLMLASWLDHLRQHERVTEADRRLQAEVHALHRGDTPPRVTHLVAAN